MRSVCLFGIIWSAESAKHLRQPVYQFSGGAWREHNPPRHGHVWCGQVLDFLSGLFRKGANCTDGEADRSSIEHGSEDVVAKEFPYLLVIPNTHSPLIHHQKSPIGTVFDLSSVNAKLAGVQS